MMMTMERLAQLCDELRAERGMPDDVLYALLDDMARFHARAQRAAETPPRLPEGYRLAKAS